MLSIDFIKKNKEKVIAGISNKGYKTDVDKLIEVDEQRKKLLTEIQNLQAKRNKLSKDEGIKFGKQIRENIQKLERQLAEIEKNFHDLSYSVANIALPDVKIGKDESENEVIKKIGNIPKFDFPVKDHMQLGEELDIIDTKSASKVSGSRFFYLKNQAVLLEFALIQYFLTEIIKEGFIPIIPPILLKKSITEKLGYWQAGGHNDYYLVNEPEESQSLLYLIGTAEHSVVPYHIDQTINIKDLPKRYVAFSTCFRREAGTYGKDTRGIFRVHQFDKIEMVSFTTPDKGDREHEFFLSIEEKLYKSLGIPYQVIKMCTADLGFPVARKYDLEAWIPSQNKYREITSTSTTTDFQARRLNIKYTDGKIKDYVHIINGTGMSTNRPLIAIIENYQQKNGTILVPKVLQKYLPFDKINR